MNLSSGVDYRGPVARESIVQHVPVQEHQRVGRLVLRRGREPPAYDQVVEERLDVGCPQRRRMAPGTVGGAVKRQKLPHPTGVDLDGARRQPPASRDDEKLLEQFHDDANFYLTSRHAVKRKSDLMRRE